MNLTLFPSSIYEPQGVLVDWSLKQFVSELIKRAKMSTSGLTYDQYMSADDRTRIKAKNGAFIFGEFKDNIRKNSNLIKRSALSIDLDDSLVNIEDLKNTISTQYLIYSTASHSVKAPRYRVILPLTRDIGADEYRALAGTIGRQIDPKFDLCSCKPAQVMFFPLRHLDTHVELAYNFQLEPLDPDAVEIYKELQVAGQYKRATDMAGLRGKFNATVSINCLLDDLLCEIYEPCSNGRYRYRDSENIAGVIINSEGDKIFSHHSTDPMADGRYHDAWDAVRIHLFGGDWKKANAFAAKYLEVVK